jgi:hypothetical protein
MLSLTQVTSGIDLAIFLTARFANKENSEKVTDVLEYQVFTPQ